LVEPQRAANLTSKSSPAVPTNLEAQLLPQQIAAPTAQEAFSDGGALQDPKRHAAVMALGNQLTQMASLLHTVQDQPQRVAA